MNLVGAVDIGGTKIAGGLIDAAGAVLEQEVCPTAQEKGLADGVARIQSMLGRCIARCPGAHLIGVGVGSTGPVDPWSGVLGPGTFLPAWEGPALLPLFEAALGVSVAFENDADAAALGEAAWGAGRGAQTCLYVTVSTGIGCGVVVDGRLYRGAGGAHPEIGHMVIDPVNGPACICGAQGCWESLASGTAMSAWYQQRRKEQGLPPDEPADAREICRQALSGEPLAQAAVEREGYYLGIGLANLVTMFIPDCIVLGGGVMQSWALFEESVRARLRQSCGQVPYERTDLRLASLGARTGLAGAARAWFHRFGA